MAKKKPNRFDDGFQSYLIEDVNLVGDVPTPEILDMHNTSIPKCLISFEKINSTETKRGYIHFFIHDKLFEEFIARVKSYIPLLQQFDGILTPDCSMGIGQLDYLQKTNNYFRQATGAYVQKFGIPVIPTVRWSDESSLEYCLNGIPHNTIIAISTHGCIKSKKQKLDYRKCLIKVLEILTPSDVLVYGYMPDIIFGGLEKYTKFHNYPNHYVQNCKKKV